MPYPKEYLIYCSLTNKNPSRSVSAVLFQSWIIARKKEYEKEQPKEEFVKWLENLKPSPHPLKQMHSKEEEDGYGY